MSTFTERSPRPEDKAGPNPAPSRWTRRGHQEESGAAAPRAAPPQQLALPGSAGTPAAAAENVPTRGGRRRFDRRRFDRRRLGAAPDPPPAPGLVPTSPVPTAPASRSRAIQIVNPKNGRVVVPPPLPDPLPSVAAPPRRRQRGAKTDTAAAPQAAPRPAAAPRSAAPAVAAAAQPPHAPRPASPPAPRPTGSSKSRRSKRGGKGRNSASSGPAPPPPRPADTFEALLRASPYGGWVAMPTGIPIMKLLPPLTRDIGEMRRLAEEAAALLRLCTSAGLGADERQRAAERARETLLMVRGGGAPGECVMCFDETADTVLMPCGCRAMCSGCGDNMGVKERGEWEPRMVACPMCGGAVEYGVIDHDVDTAVVDECERASRCVSVSTWD